VAAKREATTAERERKKLEKIANKDQRAQEKQLELKAKTARAELSKSKKRYNEA